MTIVRVFDEAADAYDNVGVDFFTPMGAMPVRLAEPRHREEHARPPARARDRVSQPSVVR